MKKIKDDGNRIIYNISDDEKDEFCINMLKTNKMQSILPVSFSDNGDIIYDFSDTVRWSVFTEKKINAEKILVILRNMCRSDIEIRENFLKNNMIIMNEEDVFINPETLDVYFCILPIHEDYKNHKVEDFIKEILFDIDTDAGELIYSIMRQLKNKNYSFSNFCNYIKNQIEEIKSEPLISNYEESEEIKSEPLTSNYEESEEIKSEPLISNYEESEEIKSEPLISNYEESEEIQSEPLTSNYEESEEIQSEPLISNYEESEEIQSEPLISNYEESEEIQSEPLTSNYEESEEIQSEPLISNYEESEEIQSEPLISNYEESEEIKSEPLISNYEESEEVNINQDLNENENWNVVSLDDMLMNGAESEKEEEIKSDDNEDEKSVDDLWGFLNSNDSLIDSFRENKDSDKQEDEPEAVHNSSDNLILSSNFKKSASDDNNKSSSENLTGNKKAYLFRQINNEEIEINKEFFMLGKYRQASYTFNNDSISRTHATIIKEDNQYFIVDNVSRNGTFVNGRKIKPNDKVKLNNRDLITLSNETLVFYIR